MDEPLLITRVWAMPAPDTFSIKPIAALLDKYLTGRTRIVDPFARNSKRGTLTNDIDLTTTAASHLDADTFLQQLVDAGYRADGVLLDPPYSRRQASEHYRAAGLRFSQQDAQNVGLWRRLKHSAALLLDPGGVAISFGWNTAGLSRRLGMSMVEILIVNHDGAHHDTLVTVESKTSDTPLILAPARRTLQRMAKRAPGRSLFP